MYHNWRVVISDIWHLVMVVTGKPVLENWNNSDCQMISTLSVVCLGFSSCILINLNVQNVKRNAEWCKHIINKYTIWTITHNLHILWREEGNLSNFIGNGHSYIIILVLHYMRQIKDVKIIREFLIVLISIHDKSGLLHKVS